MSQANTAHGYGRASDPRKQLLTDQVQRDEIRERFRRGDIDAKAGKIYMDKISSRRRHFSARPGFKRLLDVLQPGDHLIIVDLDRVSRGGLAESAEFMEEMIAGKIEVHVTRFGGGQLDLNTVAGKAMAGMMAVFAEMESGKISERTTAVIHWLRENDLPYHGRRAWGNKRRYTRRKGKKDKLHWDAAEKERCLIREIIARARTCNGSEPMQRILDDFHRRGDKRADGDPWELWMLYRARDWYLEQIEKGKVV